MIKKITETKYKYGTDGSLVEKIETVTEYEDDVKPININAPKTTFPWNPYQPLYVETPKNSDTTIFCNVGKNGKKIVGDYD